MLTFLLSLFRGKPVPGPAAADASAQAFERLNRVAPLIRSAESAARAAEPGRKMSAFICRDPVLNRGERIVGYEFSLDLSMQERLKDRGLNARKTHDALLMRELASFNVNSLLGHRLAMIELGDESVDAGIPKELPRANTVLILNAGNETACDTDASVKRIDALVKAGFQVGWKLRTFSDEILPVLARCQFARVDTPEFDGLHLKELARKLQGIGKNSKSSVQLIARDLQTFDDFQVCFRGGFDLFQGPFVTSRKSWKAPKSDVDRIRVLSLLKRLRSGADHATLAKELRTEPVLTFRLLRYVNSAAIGLQRQIGAVDQALYVLGVEKVYRWLSLLLYDMKERGYAERALIEQVLVRARTMESLSGGPLDRDLAFLTGLLSLIDQLTGRPMGEVLPQINVPTEVKNALVSHTGPYAPLLELAKVCEEGDQIRISAAAARCGLEERVVNAQLFASLNWAQEVAAAGT